MSLFEDTFGRGGRPFTTFPWAHGNRLWHSPIYNLPRTPVEGVYGKEDVFDYNPEQPFPLPNRRGILTHPAWLIAHSANTATDPVRRGKWIREKLLAGSVPDVPITVDAKIKTLAFSDSLLLLGFGLPIDRAGSRCNNPCRCLQLQMERLNQTDKVLVAPGLLAMCEPESVRCVVSGKVVEVVALNGKGIIIRREFQLE